MQFNSILYLLFLPAVAMGYFSLPQRFRWILLLGASYVFYGCWKAEYLVLIIFSTLVAYLTALYMPRVATARSRKLLLATSLLTNLGVLFAFKYFNFFSNSLGSLLNHFALGVRPPIWHVLLPVGISFYTFQALSYSIDVYRGDREPEPHLGIFALYVSFFPQLVAGPIERSTNLLPQFSEPHRFNPAEATAGLRQILWGMFKKVVIADWFSIYVNEVYGDIGAYDGLTPLLATYFFAIQIYCDFSGYSDIAIGSARIMGYRLMQNFNAPYFSASISEFWSRWHISLSTWFRDYLYIPLGGNRVQPARHGLNLIAVFVISGLWHGANWTFVLWGALHGLGLIAFQMTTPLRKRVGAGARSLRLGALYHLACVAITFHLVCAGWILFRSKSVAEAWRVLQSIAVGFTPSRLNVSINQISMGMLCFCTVTAALLFASDWLQTRTDVGAFIARRAWPLRWGFYYAVVMAILLFGNLRSDQIFIYFQF